MTTKTKEGFISNLKVLLFDEENLCKLENKSSWKYFALFLVLCSLLESLPTSIEEIQRIPFYFMTSIVKLFVLSFVVLGTGMLLGMKVKEDKFLGAVFTVLFMASILTTVLAYVSILLFQNILNWAEVAQLIQSILPFYMYALFAWGCEFSSRMTESKGIIFALLCLILVVLFSQIQIFFFSI